MKVLLRSVQKFGRLLTGEQNNILSTSLAMMGIIVVTKATGFLYSAVTARQLGTTRESDLFILANTIPEILGNLILVGLISAVLVPLLVKVKNRESHARFLKVWNTLLNAGLITFIVSGVILAIFSYEIFPFILNTLVRTQFEFSPTDLRRAANMMQILLIPQILLGISSYYSSALNVFHNFLIPQLAPLFYNIGRIIGAIFFIPMMGVEGLVWGTLLGSVLHLCIQVPLTFNYGIYHQPVIDLNDKYYKEAVKLGAPRVIGLGGEYIANGIDRFIAARFISGSVTAFDFALRLVSIPMSLFGMTFSVASFPKLSKLYQSGEYEEFNKLFLRILNQIFFIAIPVTVMLLILRVSFVRLFYGIFGGEFDFESTYLTAWGVAFFSIGLTFESVRSLIYRAFYATGDTIRPLYTAIFTMIAGIATGILFTNYFSHFDTFVFTDLIINRDFFLSYETGKAAIGGLALSSSVVVIVEFFILIYLLDRSKVDIDVKQLFTRLFKKLIAAVVMGYSMFVVFKIWGDSILQTKTFFLILFVGFTCLIGFIVYCLVAHLLKIKELETFTGFVAKLRFKNIVSSVIE